MSRWEDIGNALREVKSAIDSLEKLVHATCPHKTETKHQYADCYMVYCVDCGAELRREEK